MGEKGEERLDTLLHPYEQLGFYLVSIEKNVSFRIGERLESVYY